MRLVISGFMHCHLFKMCEKRIPAGRSLFGDYLWIKRFKFSFSLPDEPLLHTNVSILHMTGHHVIKRRDMSEQWNVSSQEPFLG